MERDELDRLYGLVELLTKRIEALERWRPDAVQSLGCQITANRSDPPCYEWLPVQGVSHNPS